MSDAERPDGAAARATGRAEQRIEDALARLGADLEPPPGWEARVLAATRAPPSRSWWRFALPGLAVAVAAVGAVVLLPRRSAADLAIEIAVPHTAVTRGSQAAVAGEVAHIAVSGGTGARAIWVYRDEKPVLRCPGDPRCRGSERALQVDLTLDRIGTYMVVALSGDRIPEPAGSYDADTASLEAAGVTVRTGKLPVE